MKRQFGTYIKSETKSPFCRFLLLALVFLILTHPIGPFSLFSPFSFTPFSAPTPISASATFELGFSPRGQSLNIILNGIRSAEDSIIVAAYSFTSRPISTALVEAHRRGVNVRVIADARANRNRHTAVKFLASHGVPVRINDRYAIFHHKFMIFDGRHVQTGSFNYSAAAVDRNTENVLLLRNVPEIAVLYIREWLRLWDESIDVIPIRNQMGVRLSY